jgi:hypothetical protein
LAVTFEDEYLVDDMADPLDDVTGGIQVGPPSADVAGIRLTFSIHGYLDIAEATGRELPPWGTTRDWELSRREFARRGIAAAEALEGELRQLHDGVEVRAVAALEPSFDTAGPGAGAPEILGFLVGNDPIGRIVDYLTLGLAARGVLEWLRSHGGDSLVVDDGVAVGLATKAILDTTHESDLTLSFVEPIRPQVREWEGETEGYLVGFRTKDKVVEVPVMLDGTVGKAVEIPFPRVVSDQGHG